MLFPIDFCVLMSYKGNKSDNKMGFSFSIRHENSIMSNNRIIPDIKKWQSNKKLLRDCNFEH